LLGLFGGLMEVRRLRKVSDGRMWASLFAVIAVYALARLMGPDAARTVGLLGFAAWLPIVVGSLRQTFVPDNRILLGLRGAFVAFNAVFLGLGPLSPDTRLSLQLVLGWIHWPVAFLMGTPAKDCFVIGRMLGEKIVLTEFVAYADLAGTLEAAKR